MDIQKWMVSSKCSLQPTLGRNRHVDLRLPNLFGRSSVYIKPTNPPTNQPTNPPTNHQPTNQLCRVRATPKIDRKVGHLEFIRQKASTTRWKNYLLGDPCIGAWLRCSWSPSWHERKLWIQWHHKLPCKSIVNTFCLDHNPLSMWGNTLAWNIPHCLSIWSTSRLKL